MERGSGAAESGETERERRGEGGGRTGRGPRVAMIRATKRYKRDDVAGERGGTKKAKMERRAWRSEVEEKGRCDRGGTERRLHTRGVVVGKRGWRALQ